MVNMLEPLDGADTDFLKPDNDNDNDSISSSDSEIDKYYTMHSTGKNRLFGRDKPLHVVLGAGKPADIILWRNKQTSACIFAAATVIWLLFERIGYHLLTFVCHSLILSLATLFLWSNLASFFNMSPPEFPKVALSEDLFVAIARSPRAEFNLASKTFRDVAAGKDLKKFLLVIVALWILSVVGSWFNLLTLFYLVFVMLLTMPALYEKNEDTVDTFAEKALVELKKQYAVLDEKVLQKLPTFPSHKPHQSEAKSNS